LVFIKKFLLLQPRKKGACLWHPVPETDPFVVSVLLQNGAGRCPLCKTGGLQPAPSGFLPDIVKIITDCSRRCQAAQHVCKINKKRLSCQKISPGLYILL